MRTFSTKIQIFKQADGIIINGRFEQQNHQVLISFALIHKFPILDHIRTS